MSLAHLMRSNKKGKLVTMCEVLDRIENRGIEKGKVLTLAELVNDGILTLKQAADEAALLLSEKQILN